MPLTTATTTPQTHVLVVVASYYGVEVQETFTDSGRPVQIGNSPLLAVPVPQGSPYIAQCRWSGPAQVEVTDGRGRTYTLTPDEPVSLALGAVRVELSLNPRFMLKRTGDSRWWEAMPWLSVVLAASLIVGQGGVLSQYRCEWLGGIHPGVDAMLQCVEQQQEPGGVGSHHIAEYLTRLLAEDYAGEDVGVLTEVQREDAERSAEQDYMPAGNAGPAQAMGGSQDVGPEEVRAPQVEEPAVAEAAPAAEPVVEPLIDDEPDVVVPDKVEIVVDKGEDGIAAVDPSDEPADDEEDAELPEEDREGWGIQDWYDEADQRMEEREIEIMTQYAHQRLRIDPNDPDALALLSYYQYLDEDFDGAVATYDKYIALLPESSAGYNNKALIYKRTGDYISEERLYRISLAFAPDDVTALNNLAVCLAHQGRFAEALDIMKRLESLDPGDPYAELHRAKIYAEMGEDALVYEHLERALQGMSQLDTLHHIEFRQDIRVDPSFESMRRDPQFRAILVQYYGKETPLK